MLATGPELWSSGVLSPHGRRGRRQRRPPHPSICERFLGVAFEEDVAVQFSHLVQAIPDARLAGALEAFSLLPDAIAPFVEAAATTPDRCRALGGALDALGAPEQASAVQDHGRMLVSR